MEQVRRKQIRLPGSVYEAGWYFVTVCTKDREELLSVIKQNVGADDSVRPYGTSAEVSICLTEIGKIVEECLLLLNSKQEGVYLDKYVIMPNHIHMIVLLEKRNGSMWASTPTKSLLDIIRSFKVLTSKAAGESLWQRSFYDHVIRNEQEYLQIWQYIDDNPAQWAEDKYYAAL